MPFGIGLDDIPGPIGDLFDDTPRKRRKPPSRRTEKKKKRLPPKPPDRSKDPSWSFRLASGLKEIREAPRGVAQLTSEVSRAAYKDIRNAVPGRDPFPYAMTRNKQGKLVVARDKNGKPIRSAGHLAESLFGLADTMVTGTGLLAKDIAVAGLVDDPTLAVIRRFDKAKAARLEKARREAEWRVSEAPLSSLGLAFGGAGVLSKAITVPQMAARMQALNPGLTKGAATRVAHEELRRPGMAAAQGIEGGLPRREIRGQAAEAVGRPWSRTPGGRLGQRIYDSVSEVVDKANPNLPFSASARASSANRRRAAQDVKREQSALAHRLDELGDVLEGKETGLALGARTREAVGASRPIRERAEALIAALEGPQDATIRQSVEARIASLEDTLRRSATLQPLADRAAVLRAKHRNTDDPEARMEIANEIRDITAELDLRTGRKVAPVRGSKHRRAAVREFEARFGKRKAAALITVADAIARSRNPSDPGAWYEQNLAQVTSESAEAFMARTDPTVRQLQTSAGWRMGLTESKAQAVNGDEAIELLRGPGGALVVLDKYGDTHFIHADKTGETGFVHQRGLGGNRWKPMTEEQVRILVDQDGDTAFHGFDEDALQRALDLRNEIPVFYSELQQQVNRLYSGGTKQMVAQSLRKRIKENVSDVEWGALGMDAFFARYHPIERIPEADIQEYLSMPVNAYNLDEVVFSSLEGPSWHAAFGERWGSGSDWRLTAKVGTADEPYYELVMVLGRTPEGKATYTKAAHWSGIDNPVVHIRFHEIVDNEGKRAILIDEIQSDWRSEARTKGAVLAGESELPVLRARQRELQAEYVKLLDESGLKQVAEMEREINALERQMNTAAQAIDDFAGGAPDEYDQLVNAAGDIRKRIDYLEDQVYSAKETADSPGPARRRMDELELELEDLQDEILTLEDKTGVAEWGLEDADLDMAVRRVMRWAHDSDIDRIIITPGEMQAYRNMTVSRAPSGARLPDPRIGAAMGDAADVWDEFSGMDHDAVRRYGRTLVDDEEAKVFFDLYEKTYPAKFEQAIGHKGSFREGIFNGQYGDQAGFFETGESPVGGWVIDLGEEGRRRASIPMRQMQRQPDWDALPRGATELLADGRRAMRLFEEADVDTVIHELAHIALPDIDAESLAIIERHFGGEVGKWTEQQHEAFARAFEHYFRSGRAANVELASAFTAIGKWMRETWKKLRGTEADDEFRNTHPEVWHAFDRILGYEGVPTVLSKTERSQVNSQIATLRRALDEPLESEQFQAALEALEVLSEQIEEAGQEILLRNADTPELAAAIKEGLRRRRDLMTTRMAEQGVIDWTPETRARGYFPQTSIWDIQGMPQAQPVRMAAVQDVVGTPRLQPTAVMRKPNRLIRYSTGEVLNDPAVLVKVLRARLRFLETLNARRELWEGGGRIKKGGDIPRNVALIRNPDVVPEKIKDDIYAATRLSPERYSELEMRGKMDDIDEVTDLQEAVSEFYWDPTMGGPKPHWIRDVENVRTIPLKVARNRLGDVFTSAPRGVLPAIAGSANAMSRLAAIYLPFGGTRYVARNAAQNAVMLALTQPTALAKVGRAHRKFKNAHPETYSKILAEGGTILGTALPEFNVRPTGRTQQVERYLTERTGTAGSFLGKWADNPFRWSSWTKHAEKRGFHGAEGYERLLNADTPELRDIREQVMQATRDDMIDFDALTPFEREVVSRYMYLWPFIRGITKWPFMYAREYPLRATAMLQLPKDEEGEQGTGAVRERLLMGGKDFAWLDPTGPMQENVERAERIWRGKNEAKLSAVADMLAPHYREILQSFSDRQGVTWKKALANTYVPFASTVNALSRGGSPIEQFDRFMGQNAEPPISIVNQRKERAAEINGYLDEMESRGLSIGEDGVQQLITAHNAYERYKELSARVGFGLRDQGKDPSLGKDSKNHRLRASILLAVADEFYPGSVPLTLDDYDNLTEEGRKAFYSEIEKGLWGMRQEFLTEAKKAFA